MILLVVDELGYPEKNFGIIDHVELSKIVQVAENNDFDCLSFISFESDTIFNPEQMAQIKKEIKILKKHQEINSDLLNKIHEAIKFGFSDDCLYLKFQKKDS